MEIELGDGTKTLTSKTKEKYFRNLDQRPLHERYEDVLQKRQENNEKRAIEQAKIEYEKDPENFINATHRVAMSKGSVRIMQNISNDT